MQNLLACLVLTPVPTQRMVPLPQKEASRVQNQQATAAVCGHAHAITNYAHQSPNPSLSNRRSDFSNDFWASFDAAGVGCGREKRHSLCLFTVHFQVRVDLILDHVLKS